MKGTYHGTPCKRAGHTERYVSAKQCVVCGKASSRKWREENPEKHKAHSKKMERGKSREKEGIE